MFHEALPLFDVGEMIVCLVPEAIIRGMVKKVKRKAKQAVEPPLDAALETEAAYYARKVGITIDEAAKLIRDAHAPKLSIVRKGQVKVSQA